MLSLLMIKKYLAVHILRTYHTCFNIIKCMIQCTSFTKTPSTSKTAPLLFLLVLAPFPFSTIWAYPLTIWRCFQADAFVMEPFFNAQAVTAAHHIAICNAIAKAIRWLKPLALVVVKLVYKI